MIDVRGLSLARLLKALYNNAKPQGLGVLVARAKPMTDKEAEEMLSRRMHQGALSFDYIEGRVLKVALGTDHLDERLYDRDNGPGAAARAIREEFRQ